jgi:hypothetical protein
LGSLESSMTTFTVARTRLVTNMAGPPNLGPLESSRSHSAECPRAPARNEVQVARTRAHQRAGRPSACNQKGPGTCSGPTGLAAAATSSGPAGPDCKAGSARASGQHGKTSSVATKRNGPNHFAVVKVWKCPCTSSRSTSPGTPSHPTTACLFPFCNPLNPPKKHLPFAPKHNPLGRKHQNCPHSPLAK